MSKKEYRYEGMTNEQVEVLNKFTQFKSATIIQKKMVEVIGNGELVKDWVYDGYKDTGFFGGDKCSMGHTLRYVHIAKNIKTDEKVKFGVKCVSDFFHITQDKLKMIQEGFVQVNKMVDNIVERFRDGHYRLEEMKKKFSELQQKPEHNDEIKELFSVDLPLPWQYDEEINKIWFREYSGREFQKFLDDNPQYLGIVTMAQLCEASDTFKVKHPKLYAKMKDIVNYLNKMKKLSEPQINLLNKIMMMDYDTIDIQIEALNKLQPSDFLRRGDYNEYSIFISLVEQYEDWGLSTKQVELMQKIYNRCAKKIAKLNEQELSMVE